MWCTLSGIQGYPPYRGCIHEKYPVEREVVPVYYGVGFHACNILVECSSRKVSEDAKKGCIQRMISNSVALLMPVALEHNSGIALA